jgi:hypothetical protein
MFSPPQGQQNPSDPQPPQTPPEIADETPDQTPVDSVSLLAQIHQMQDSIAQLTAQLAHTSASAPTVSPTHQKSPKIKEPETFDGGCDNSRTRVRNFLSQCDDHTNASKLTNLRQQGSAAVFAAEFRRLSFALDWDDKALAFLFYKGLKENVKDELSRIPRIDALDELVEMAITVDNRAHVRGRERDSKDRTSGGQFCKTNYSAPSAPCSNYSTASAAPKVDDGGVRPMEIDTSRSRGPLSDDQKAVEWQSSSGRERED